MPNELTSRSWVLPDEPVPVRLMTTIWADPAGLHDDLRAPSDVDAWLDAIGAGRAGLAATTDELTMARGLRDAVRLLAAYVTADTRTADTRTGDPTTGAGDPITGAGDPATGTGSAGAGSAVTSVEEAVNWVNGVAAKAPAPALLLGDRHLERGVQPGTSRVTAGLASVAREAIEMFGGDGAGQLRACYAPGCVLYFIKTHPRREWCSIACGNRVRAARHYQRARSGQ